MPRRTSSATPPPSKPGTASVRAWLDRPWVWAGLAFIAGLLLSVVVLMRGGREDPLRASDTAPAGGSREYAPLPVPLPSDGANTVRLPRPPEAGPAGRAEPRVVETRPAPPPSPAERASPEATAYVEPQPIPGRTPPPRYPKRSLRRGEEGVVSVRAQIGPDGVPTSVSIVSGSGSRDLDRAALEAVRRWRFRPAQQNGRPTVGTVVIPIEFARD
jgi:protein TonB